MLRLGRSSMPLYWFLKTLLHQDWFKTLFADLPDYFVGGGNMSESKGKVEQAGQMHLLVDAACTVGQEKHTIVAIIGVTGGRFTAHIGHNAGDHQILYPHTAQNGLQIRVVKGRITVLGDDLFVRQGGDVAMYLAFGTSFDAHSLPPPFHNASVALAGMMHVLSVNHRTTGTSEG